MHRRLIPWAGETREAWRVLTTLPHPRADRPPRLQLCSPPPTPRWGDGGNQDQPQLQTSPPQRRPRQFVSLPSGPVHRAHDSSLPTRPGPRWMLTPCLPRESLIPGGQVPSPSPWSKAGCAAGAQQSPAGLDAFNWRGCWEGAVHTDAHAHAHTHAHAHAHAHAGVLLHQDNNSCCNAHTHPKGTFPQARLGNAAS